MVLNVDMHEVIVCQTPYDYILLNKLNCGAGTKLAINNIDWQSNVVICFFASLNHIIQLGKLEIFFHCLIQYKSVYEYNKIESLVKNHKTKKL